MLLPSRLGDESPRHLRMSELVSTSILLASVDLTSRSFDGHITLGYKVTQRAFYELLKVGLRSLSRTAFPPFKRTGLLQLLMPPTVSGALSSHLFHNKRLLDFSHSHECTFTGKPKTQLYLSQPSCRKLLKLLTSVCLMSVNE